MIRPLTDKKDIKDKENFTIQMFILLIYDINLVAYST